MADRNSTSYINTKDYDDLKDKLKELKSVLDDLQSKNEASRKLRFAEVDIEAERESGRLQPDELYVPTHIINTNITREQSAYVQYITQSPRAVICRDSLDSAFDLSRLEVDLTSKLRYDGWQLPLFAAIDGMQQDGYNVVEVVFDKNNPGKVGVEHFSQGEFAFTSDTRDIQAVEMTARTYYFTKTRLLALCGDGSDLESDFSKEQVDKIIDKDPDSRPTESSDAKDKSLYRVYKFMFRISGVVHVAWGVPDTCDDWVRIPVPLFIGRMKQSVQPQQAISPLLNPQAVQQQPTFERAYETQYPYILFPYLISENDCISDLKGRVFLDQDLQEAVSSLLSSTITQARRAAGLYFSKEVDDPNDDLLLQKNIFFKSGCLINSKVKELKLSPPDPAMFSSIQMLVQANQNETSQTNFAAMNRKDSRKTATELKLSEQAQQVLSTVQVVLFSIALTQMYRLMVAVTKSRILANLIVVDQTLLPLYQREFIVKPSGDTDVIEKQELIKKMMDAWQVVEKTPFAQVFLMDLLSLSFPDRIAKYQKILDDATAQQNSQQAQQQQQFMQLAKQMGENIIELSKHADYFSEIGKLHAYPLVERGAAQLEQIQKQLQMK